MPRLWRTRHVLRRGRDTPDQLGREAFLNKMLIIGTCCDLLRLGRSPFLLPSRLARAVEAMSGPLIWTGRESNPRPTRIHFEGVTAILELGVPNKGEGCFEWRSLRSTGMNRIGHDPCARQRSTSPFDRPHTRTAFLLVGPRLSGCHVICRPATHHGIEPPPFLPSLDKRSGIEPALSLLVAGDNNPGAVMIGVWFATPRFTSCPPLLPYSSGVVPPAPYRDIPGKFSFT